MAELSLEARVARIEGILEQMDGRLNHLESGVSSLREKMSRRLDSMFRWIVGLILGMWTTTMMTLIPILLKILGVI